MTYVFNRILTIRTLLLAGMLMTLTPSLFAEPYLAVRTGQKCSACHVNPLGGGARNSFGSYYGSQVLPAKAGDAQLFDNGMISEILRIGGDLRVNLNTSDVEGADATRSFNTQSGQLYFALQPKGTPVMLYFDQQFAPGSAINREAWAMLKLGDTQHYLKAGTLMLPFGYRFEDDTALVRTLSKKTFDTNDTGVELGLEFSRATVNVVVSNGSSSANNPDDKFSYTLRGEWIGSFLRAGASAQQNTTELAGVEAEETLFAIFGGANLWGFNFIAEVDSVEAVVSGAGESAGDNTTPQLAGLVELNRELTKGYNLKLTHEWLDPNTDIDNNQRTRNSLLLEATPYASVQFRTGIRKGDDIPQREAGNFTEWFLQMHLYY